MSPHRLCLMDSASSCPKRLVLTPMHLATRSPSLLTVIVLSSNPILEPIERKQKERRPPKEKPFKPSYDKERPKSQKRSPREQETSV